MEDLWANVNAIKIVGRGDKVYKDECVYSFDTPVCSIFIVLSFYGGKYVKNRARFWGILFYFFLGIKGRLVC